MTKRLRGRLQNRKGKTHSQATKVVIVKSTLESMSIYQMGCYMLLKLSLACLILSKEIFGGERRKQKEEFISKSMVALCLYANL